MDRGFRDVTANLSEMGFQYKMPSYKDKNSSQLTTEQANSSRLVTSCRWVIESVNGQLKKFKYFDNKWSNKSLPHLMDDFRIAGSLINCFRDPIITKINNVDIIGDNMLNNVAKLNLLSNIIEEHNLNRKSKSFMIFNTFSNLPKLSEKDLEIHIACGTYQMKIAKSYYSEHVKDDGLYRINIHKHVNIPSIEYDKFGINVTTPILIRAKIKSRFRSNKEYFVYVLFDIEKDGIDSIQYYHCQCLSGKRTVGCCGHIMTVIWYLTFARNQVKINQPSSHLDNLCIHCSNPDSDSD